MEVKSNAQLFKKLELRVNVKQLSGLCPAHEVTMTTIKGKAIAPQRQRVLDALQLREPDRVPIGLWGTIEGYQNLRKAVGLDYKADTRDYRTGSTTWTTDVSFEIDLAFVW